MNIDQNVYEQEFIIRSYFTDCKSELAPQELLLLMQEVAWSHVEKHQVGWAYLQQFNFFWAITRIHARIIRMPKWNEKVVLKTWGKLSDRIAHFRDHEMLDADGKVIMESTSTWVILDTATGRPQKVENLPTHLYVNEHKNAIVENAPKIKAIPSGDKVPCYKPVLYSDIDVNQHVNNSKYLQFALDDLDINFIEKHRLTEFMINFLWQAKKGDYYTIQKEEIEKNNFISAIFSKEEKRELARVQTLWEKL